MTNQSINDRLLAAQVAIDKALSNKEVAACLEEYGYNAPRIQEGKFLYEKLQNCQQKLQSEYKDLLTSVNTEENTWEDARKTYRRLVRLARIALKSNQKLAQKLDLTGPRKRALPDWRNQVNQFYINALKYPAILDALGKFGITTEKLQAGQLLLWYTKSGHTLEKEELEDAQQSILKRDAALDKLEEWLVDFMEVAQIALEEKPHLLAPFL